MNYAYYASLTPLLNLSFKNSAKYAIFIHIYYQGGVVMGIILKYIMKSISEKKLRTFLIIASVAVSSALVFASAAISGTLVDMFGVRMKQYFGTSDFIVHLNSDTSGRATAQRAPVSTGTCSNIYQEGSWICGVQG
jgi:hypothetical protein